MRRAATLYWDLGEMPVDLVMLFGLAGHLKTAVNGVFHIFCEKRYVSFKNVLVIVENIELIREQVVVFN